MNAQQSQTLSLIAKALTELASGTGSALADGAMTACGGTAIGGNRLTEPVMPQSEVERELARVTRANEKMELAIERAWKRVTTITNPPGPSEANCAQAIESCGSSLGNSLQSAALRIEAQASSLNYLIDSLAV